jgi:phosphoribosylanthranilate isomerase
LKKPIKIKVCGMLHPDNMEEVCALEPDLVGYIFYTRSSRFVGERPDPALFRIPGERIAKAGVFVNEELTEVKRKYEQYLLDLVQLHGNESPDYCMDLIEEGIPVIKVFHPGSPEEKKLSGDFRKNLERYGRVARYYLFDSGETGAGGTGQKFNWNLLGGIVSPLPFFLGGGLGPGDAGAVKQLDLLNFFGVDLNSRFEFSPGLKDPGLLKRFINEIRK